MLGAGLVSTLLNVKPVSVIIFAQAFNGMLLPFAALFIFFLVNNPAVMGRDNINSLFLNSITVLVVAAAVTLGVSNLLSAVNRIAGEPLFSGSLQLGVSGAAGVVLMIPVCVRVVKVRRVVVNPKDKI